MLCHLHCQHMVAPDFYWLPQRRTSVHNIPKIMLKLEPPICPAAQAHSWKHARDITTDEAQQYALGRKGMEGKKFKDCGPAKGYPPPYYPPYSPSPDYKSPPYSPTPDYKSPPYSPTPDYKPPESPAYKLVSESTESPPS
ncbi:uncharacterized protein [Physcomitrium patens]|uniref:Uncharacterized protein n=1 Tax=Physcomitrium patens TaxID=3218 RepID=A0A7I4EDY3_PHYPA|nr:cyclin-K-like isoform X2 [Physcomitrium patens]|eukprot:XP_024377799.1 cyclin-K-like isoform X2 [Physcomitrella patens]